MSNRAPKVDLVSKLVFLISLLAIVAVVYVLVSSLINTYQRNSTKGEIDPTQNIMKVEDNLKPIGISSTSGAPVASATGRGGKEIYDAVCTACHSTGVLESPKLGDKAAWETRAAAGLDALLATATNGKGSMPAKGGDPSLTDAEIRTVVLYITKEAGLDLGGAAEEKKEVPATEATAAPKEEEAKTEEKAEEKPVAAVVAPTPAKAPEPEPTPKSEPAPAAPVVAAAPVAAEAPAAPSAEGKKVYDTACFVCHATGVAGSPKLGDKALWAPRIATGMDALYQTSLNGKGAMPPKGGNMSLADDSVKAAVDYMVSQSK